VTDDNAKKDAHIYDIMTILGEAEKALENVEELKMRNSNRTKDNVRLNMELQSLTDSLETAKSRVEKMKTKKQELELVVECKLRDYVKKIESLQKKLSSKKLSTDSLKSNLIALKLKEAEREKEDVQGHLETRPREAEKAKLQDQLGGAEKALDGFQHQLVSRFQMFEKAKDDMQQELETRVRETEIESDHILHTLQTELEKAKKAKSDIQKVLETKLSTSENTKGELEQQLVTELEEAEKARNIV